MFQNVQSVFAYLHTLIIAEECYNDNKFKDIAKFVEIHCSVVEVGWGMQWWYVSMQEKGELLLIRLVRII